MLEDKLHPASQCCRIGRQAGAFAVEFALVVLVFFTFIFGVIELARAMYLWNTLQEATRSAARAAANTNFSDATAMNLVRQHAIFRTSAGTLVMGDPVTDAHIRIDYMSLIRNADGSMTITPIPDAILPSFPGGNRFNCIQDPNGGNCIRFVRARVCAPGDTNDCSPVSYVPLLPLVKFSALHLPRSTTIVRAESLGYTPGMPVGP
jgi:hypothetical protein